MCWLPMVHLLCIFRFSLEVHKQEAFLSLRAEHESQWHVEPPTRKTSRMEYVLHIAAFYLLCLSNTGDK